METVEKRLKTIENELFKATNHKLDSYSLALIRATILANEPLIQSNEQLSATMKNILKTEHYYFYNPVSAWFGLAAKFFFPSVTVAFLGVLIYWSVREIREDTELYKQAQSIVFWSEDFKRANPKLYDQFFRKPIENYQTTNKETDVKNNERNSR
jgi:hypothetical protein